MNRDPRKRSGPRMIAGRGTRFGCVRSVARIALMLMLLVVSLGLAAGPASALGPYCGRMTVRAASGPLHIGVQVMRGRVSCRKARWVTAYAWSPRHRSRRGNKFLGDPPGWTCAVARITTPTVAGNCRRKRDGALVSALNDDYGE